MFSKILVANRGEIAIRAFRAGYELGAKTVAVFPHEDRNSIHRQKADEAYLIGEEGHPVRAYLDVDEVVRVAKESGADAIYPGYGFLSENPRLARAAAAAGITFVGPPAEVLELAGNKVAALEAARKAGVPVLKSSQPSKDLDELIAAADEIGFPIFAKAVAGGGGRGMRRVDTREALPEALQAAMREADAAFGDPTMFLEQAVLRPRHIEVQILADAEGNVMHLFERDCSIQRRHQKVIEIAPAPNLDEGIRQALYRDAVKFAKALNYVNAGTVEFLVDTVGERAGQHVFIEMNPRIQVEHTVTEEVTDVDLVQAQLRIAAGETLADLGLSQETVQLKGAALQCRITTEDPANGFRPDVGKITGYRSAGGAGVRLDGGTVYSGAEISPHFDSMLVKLTCRGRDYPAAVARARRALAEFRIRGVVHQHLLPAGRPGRRRLRRRQRGHLVHRRTPRTAEGTGLRGPRHQAADLARRRHGQQAQRRAHGPQRSRRQAPGPGRRRGPAGLPPAAAGAGPGRLRAGPARAGRRRRHGHHVPRRAPVPARDPGPHPRPRGRRPGRVQAPPGAALRRGLGRRHLRRRPALPRRRPLGPARRAAQGACRTSACRCCSAAATPSATPRTRKRSRSPSSTRPPPPASTSSASSTRSTTSTRWPRPSAPSARPARPSPRWPSATPPTCWTRTRRSTPWTTTWSWPQKIVDAGAHILAIKDMAGLLRPAAAARLVTALRERFDLPVHLHTHDTAGGQLATLLAAVDAGVDAVDVASASLAGHHQPALRFGPGRRPGPHARATPA